MNIQKLHSDANILAEIGARISSVRLNKNITQKDLAKNAGVSLPTVQRLEQGESTSTVNLIRIIRVLDLLENFNLLVPEFVPSPIMQLKLHGERRERASGERKNKKIKPKVDNKGWQWSD